MSDDTTVYISKNSGTNADIVCRKACKAYRFIDGYNMNASVKVHDTEPIELNAGDVIINTATIGYAVNYNSIASCIVVVTK